MADDPKDDVTTEETPEKEVKVEGVEEEASDPEPSSEEAKVEEAKVEEVKEDDDYQFDDDLTSSEPSSSEQTAAPAAPKSGGSGGGKYAQELFSKTIHAKFRTFYVDLKESTNGKFIKVSEKSRGRKSTIMMDAEDVPAMIEALQEVQKQL